MTLNQYKAKLEEWKKAREAATRPEWQIYSHSDGTDEVLAWLSSDEESEISIAQALRLKKNEINPDMNFIVLSANHWTELIDAHIKAIEALETVLPYADEREIYALGQDELAKEIKNYRDLLLQLADDAQDDEERVGYLKKADQIDTLLENHGFD